jgi:amino acid adenylation domain-containing protein
MEALSLQLVDDKPRILEIDGSGGGQPLRTALDLVEDETPASPADVAPSSSGDLAYILYTSGSTGAPKGVMLTLGNAMSFIDWCSETFEPTTSDRFSSHAPFHFDLSILDIYVPVKHGATLVLISEEVGKNPFQLASLIAEEKISSWYSTPSVLNLLTQYGKLDQHDYTSLRRVIFAGEVFPVKHLRELKRFLPSPRYYNLYGPTETNVCTFHEIRGPIEDERARPFPIGKACSHYQIKVVDERGQDVTPGKEGELYASGLGVMRGYWNLNEQTASTFLEDSSGRRWYKTGDIVFVNENGDFVFVGRRDRMVKRRGYRVELGEIEVGLYSHPSVAEAAVVALSDPDEGVRIRAFLSFRGETPPSIVDMKSFCADKLPAYMIPDLFTFREFLPKTSTDKIDYQKLAGKS